MIRLQLAFVPVGPFEYLVCLVTHKYTTRHEVMDLVYSTAKCLHLGPFLLMMLNHKGF